MGQISMSTRDELVVALSGRYGSSNRKERGRILDEFVVVSGLHRKHAMRLDEAVDGGDGHRRIGERGVLPRIATSSSFARKSRSA